MVAPAPVKPKIPEGFAQYGITLKFPEYEKSAYVPEHEAGRGRVWVLTPKGKLTPVYVEVGVSDGRYTEVHSRNLSPGTQIVIGANSTTESSSDQARNVLTGGGQPRMMGGGFR